MGRWGNVLACWSDPMKPLVYSKANPHESCRAVLARVGRAVRDDSRAGARETRLTRRGWTTNFPKTGPDNQRENYQPTKVNEVDSHRACR